MALTNHFTGDERRFVGKRAVAIPRRSTRGFVLNDLQSPPEGLQGACERRMRAGQRLQGPEVLREAEVTAGSSHPLHRFEGLFAQRIVQRSFPKAAGQRDKQSDG